MSIVLRLSIALLIGAGVAVAILGGAILYKRATTVPPAPVARSAEFITTDLGTSEGVTLRLIVHRSLGRQWLIVENDRGISVQEVRQ